MDYDTFKENAMLKLKDYLPEEYQNYDVKVNRVRKVNVTRDVLNIISDGDFSVSPNIYVDNLYGYYMQNGDFDQAMKEAVKYFIAGMEYAEKLDMSIGKGEYGGVEDRIIVSVINREKNTEFLSLIPHKDIMDLSAIFRILVDVEDEHFSTTVVNYALMNRMGLDEEGLYRLAISNTEKVMPLDCIKVDDDMYILTNKSKLFGASGILFCDELKKIADAAEDDLYLLPSSIHEIFIVSSRLHSLEYLKNVVSDANRKVVLPEDILSDSVYYYSRAENAVTQC